MILIISHTNHYLDSNGQVVGFGSTVKELNFLAETHGPVTHIGVLHKKTPPPKNSIPYTANVRFVPLPPYGGASLGEKLSIITNAFTILGTVRRELKKARIFQFRAPTSMGLYVIPYLTMFSSKPGWYKYAGNWEQPNPPSSHKIQKRMLTTMQKRPVTINGRWAGQPANCLTFENPCLTAEDRKEGATVLANKKFAAPYTICFVGRLEKEKGIFALMEALKVHPNVSAIGQVHIIGEGPGKARVEEMAQQLPCQVTIHGSMNREPLFDIYKQSHFIILPSDSEGFPKVIAEAANFACIPIVSDVSCIGQYVGPDNGYLWNKANASFPDFMKAISFTNEQELSAQAANAYQMAASFTYERYVQHLDETVFRQYGLSFN